MITDVCLHGPGTSAQIVRLAQQVLLLVEPSPALVLLPVTALRPIHNVLTEFWGCWMALGK